MMQAEQAQAAADAEALKKSVTSLEARLHEAEEQEKVQAQVSLVSHSTTNLNRCTAAAAACCGESSVSHSAIALYYMRYRATAVRRDASTWACAVCSDTHAAP